MKKQVNVAGGTPGWVGPANPLWVSPEGVQYLIYVTTVTPAMARLWLFGEDGKKEQKNVRTIGPDHLRKMSDDLVSGRWLFTGEPIILDAFGFVVDGQHRLAMCIKTDTPFDAVVVEGILEGADMAIDIGKTRRFEQFLSRRGEKDARVLQSAIACLWRMGRDIELTSHTPSVAEHDQILMEHPSLRASAAKTSHAPRGCAKSALCVVHYLASKWDPAAADRFVEAVKKGHNLAEDNPVLRFRARLAGPLSPPEVLALLIKTWNFWVEGKTVKFLVYRVDEAFPKLSFPDAPARSAPLSAAVHPTPGAHERSAVAPEARPRHRGGLGPINPRINGRVIAGL